MVGHKNGMGVIFERLLGRKIPVKVTYFNANSSAIKGFIEKT